MGETIPLGVDHVEIPGADTIVYGQFPDTDTRITIRLNGIHRFDRKTTLSLFVSPEKIHLFDGETKRRI